MHGRHGTDDTIGDELVKTVNGQDDVHVGSHAGPIEVRTQMTEHKVATTVLKLTERLVAGTEGVVAGVVQRCGGDNGNVAAVSGGGVTNAGSSNSEAEAEAWLATQGQSARTDVDGRLGAASRFHISPSTPGRR